MLDATLIGMPVPAHETAMRRPPVGLGRLVDRGLDLILVAHVALDERDAELLGERLALLRVDVGDDDVRAVLVQPAGGGLAEARRAARDEGAGSFDLHA